jgi:nitroreductase
VEFDDAIRRRRSIRRFQPRALSAAAVEELLDLARHAPSSMNGQPWRFIVVRQPEVKAALARIKNRYCPPEKREYAADFLAAAPVIVAVCVEGPRAWNRAVENGVLAASFLMLAAASRGIGSVYLSGYQRDEPRLAEEIQRLLALPGDVAPISLVPLGYAAESPAPKTLRPLAEMVSDGER